MELEKIGSTRYSTESLIVENDNLDIDNINNESLLDKRELIVDLNEEEEDSGLDLLEIDKENISPGNMILNKDRGGTTINESTLPLS